MLQVESHFCCFEIDDHCKTFLLHNNHQNHMIISNSNNFRFKGICKQVLLK